MSYIATFTTHLGTFGTKKCWVLVIQAIYMALSSTRQHFSLKVSFFQVQSDGCQFSWKLNFFKIPKACFYSYNVYLRKFKFQLLGVILGAHRTPKIGCFSKSIKFMLLYYLVRKKAITMVFI